MIVIVGWNMPGPLDDPKPVPVLREETGETLLQFLQIEISTARTMLELANTEMGLDRAGAVQALGNAERARAELLRWLDRAAARKIPTAGLIAEADDIGRRIAELRARLKAVRGPGAV
jgi:hypothetical protein